MTPPVTYRLRFGASPLNHDVTVVAELVLDAVAWLAYAPAEPSHFGYVPRRPVLVKAEWFHATFREVAAEAPAWPSRTLQPVSGYVDTPTPRKEAV